LLEPVARRAQRLDHQIVVIDLYFMGPPMIE
jgi:hypothetical protein